MKTLLSLLVALSTAVAIVSCDKSDAKEENPATSPLYGTWESVTLDVSGCVDPLANHSTNCAAGGAICSGATIAFSRTTLTSTGLWGTSNSPYTIRGNTYNYPSDGGVPTTFSIAGTTLTLTYQNPVSNGGCLIVSTYIRI